MTLSSSETGRVEGVVRSDPPEPAGEIGDVQ
jgi:hypothetical protein